MKKYISLLIFTVLFLNKNLIFAQSINLFGVKGGVNLMEIRDKLNDDSVAKENKTGFYLGAFMEFRKSVNFSIQAEINYSGTNNKTNDQIGLLHIPVLFKYKVANKVEIYGGPESQFLLSVSRTDIKNKQYKKFILAADLGVGFLITDELTLDARYNLAVSNYMDFGPHRNKKLNFIQIGLAYKFDN